MATAAPPALIVGRLAPEPDAEGRLLVLVRLSGCDQPFPVPVRSHSSHPPQEPGSLLGVIGTWHGEPPDHWIQATRIERLGGPR